MQSLVRAHWTGFLCVLDQHKENFKVITNQTKTGQNNNCAQTKPHLLWWEIKRSLFETSHLVLTEECAFIVVGTEVIVIFNQL